MKLLLDTHIFLWLNDRPEKLSVAAMEACGNAENSLYLSLISLWEIQIKRQLGKLDIQAPWQEMMKTQKMENGLEVLPLKESHIEQLDRLEPHHRDPFDRMLISQAQVEGMEMVSADRAFTSYNVALIW